MIEDYDTMKVFNNKYIGNETDLGESAAGKLRKYAKLSLIEQEKDAWRKAAIKKHAEE